MPHIAARLPSSSPLIFNEAVSLSTITTSVKMPLASGVVVDIDSFEGRGHGGAAEVWLKWIDQGRSLHSKLSQLLISTAPEPLFFANSLPPYHGEKVRRF